MQWLYFGAARISRLSTRRRCQLQYISTGTAQKAKSNFWPIHLINDAYIHGLIPLSPNKAVALLSDFRRNENRRLNVDELNILLRDHGAQPSTLFWLGWILQKHVLHDISMAPIVKRLQCAAAALRDENASLILVESALRARKPNHSDIRDAVRNLQELSAQGSIHSRERLAALYEQRGDQIEALALADEVLQAQTCAYEKENPVLDRQFHAWQTVSRIRGNLGDRNEQLKALTHGATVLEDPEACFTLSNHDSTPSETRFPYLLKAASSGFGRAALMVGNCYYFKATGNSMDHILSTFKTSDVTNVLQEKFHPGNFHLRLASEWFRVALQSRNRGPDFNRENAGTALMITLCQLRDYDRCLKLLEEYSETKWAKSFITAGKPLPLSHSRSRTALRGTRVEK